MTIFAFEAQESWLPTAIGMTCAAVELDEDAVLRLLFGATHRADDGVLEAERMITVSGVWRVEQADEVIAGSGDLDDPDRAWRLNRVVGGSLERVEVSHPGFELAVFLDNDSVVRCFPCDPLEFAEDVEYDDDVAVSWWVDGIGIPDDWETPNDIEIGQSGA